jgi:hypothetical protein
MVQYEYADQVLQDCYDRNVESAVQFIRRWDKAIDAFERQPALGNLVPICAANGDTRIVKAGRTGFGSSAR